jgi:uncharacterized membrane protein YkoI
MPNLRVLTFTALATIGLSAMPLLAAEDQSHEAQEKPIQLSQVPKAAVDAGEKAIGGKATEAKVLQQDGQQIYEIERKDSSGTEHSAHVSADGKVLKTE